MKKILILLLFTCLEIKSQQLQYIQYDTTEKRAIPSSSFLISSKLKAHTNYTLSLETKAPFSCFGVGWKINKELNPEQLNFRYRTKKRGKEWSSWITANAHFSPKETPTNMYWTDALFTYDATSQDFIELELSSTVIVDAIQIDVLDGNYESYDFNLPKNNNKLDPCPDFPTIISRNEWCGGSAPCNSVNAHYAVENISPSHVIIHHGASPNTYTNGASVVRSYWNYHVNSLGWSDIGYNYLLDDLGNLYQGRYNPNMPTTDVRAAHAINYNAQSIGVCFLGHTDFTISTTNQLNKLYDLLGWWFKQKGFDPTSSASINGNIKPRIMGHRDVSATVCPGDDLYSKLDTIRAQTKILSNAVCEILNVNEYNNLSDQSSTRLYPNPNNGNFSIFFVSKKNSITPISIYDLSGKIVFSQKFQVKKGENNIVFNVKEKSLKGVYVLQIDHGDKQESKKIIIEN